LERKKKGGVLAKVQNAIDFKKTGGTRDTVGKRGEGKRTWSRLVDFFKNWGYGPRKKRGLSGGPLLKAKRGTEKGNRGGGRGERSDRKAQRAKTNQKLIY